MKLAPGTALTVELLTDETTAPTPVGRLAMAGGIAQLEWSRDLLATPLPIAPLRPLLEPGLNPARTRIFGGLHGFLADSLPDAWGQRLLQRRLAAMGHRLADLDAVDRLALVGRHGRGALTFRPETLPDATVGTIDLDALAADAQAVIAGEATDADALLARLGGGSGGARPKLHVTIANEGTLGASDTGGDEWIVKFPAPGDPPDIGPVEEAYARMARAAGLIVAETRLLPSASGPGYFATRRFDRPAPGKRLHMVSLGGALDADSNVPSIDYDGFLRATLAITRDMRDVEAAFRRMVFNVLAHNCDDHVRQHAYLMDARGEWRLAPAFDLTFSEGPGGAHYLAVEGEGRNVTHAHVEALGARHGLRAKATAMIIDDVRAALADWPRHARETGVASSSAAVERQLADVERAFIN